MLVSNTPAAMATGPWNSSSRRCDQDTIQPARSYVVRLTGPSVAAYDDPYARGGGYHRSR